MSVPQWTWVVWVTCQLWRKRRYKSTTASNDVYVLQFNSSCHFCDLFDSEITFCSLISEFTLKKKIIQITMTARPGVETIKWAPVLAPITLFFRALLRKFIYVLYTYIIRVRTLVVEKLRDQCFSNSPHTFLGRLFVRKWFIFRGFKEYSKRKSPFSPPLWLKQTVIKGPLWISCFLAPYTCVLDMLPYGDLKLAFAFILAGITLFA